jgi:hypothetical protein
MNKRTHTDREPCLEAEIDWPVRWFLRLVEATLPKDWREPFVGDLLEEFSTEIAPSLGHNRAQWWLLKQVGKSAVVSIPSAVQRPTMVSGLLLMVALMLGWFSMFVDSRPTWDDTGLLAMGILVVCGVFGGLGPKHPWLWALAVGMWIPAHNILAHHRYSSLLAFVFAAVGAHLGAWARWLITRIGSGNGPSLANS